MGFQNFEKFLADIGKNTLEIDNNVDDIAANANDTAINRGNIISITNNVTSNTKDILSNNDNIESVVEDVSNILENTAHLSNAIKCSATNWGYGCCTTYDPCTLNQGDCNSDDECYGDLKCGTDNCLRFNDSGTYVDN